MRKASLWSAETWIPARGRVTICRCNDCCAPATDEVRTLCTFHAKWQPKRLAHDSRQVAREERQQENVALFTPPGWAARAACRSHPEVDFFVEGTGAEVAAERAAAKKVCASCLVRAECLEAGLDERFGVWGGLGGRERERLGKARRGKAA